MVEVKQDWIGCHPPLYKGLTSGTVWANGGASGRGFNGKTPDDELFISLFSSEDECTPNVILVRTCPEHSLQELGLQTLQREDFLHITRQLQGLMI